MNLKTATSVRRSARVKKYIRWGLIIVSILLRIAGKQTSIMKLYLAVALMVLLAAVVVDARPGRHGVSKDFFTH